MALKRNASQPLSTLSPVVNYRATIFASRVLSPSFMHSVNAAAMRSGNGFLPPPVLPAHVRCWLIGFGGMHRRRRTTTWLSIT